MEDQLNVFCLHSTCYICKRVFNGSVGSQAYDRIKRNNKRLLCCEDCKDRIELEARLQLGKRLLLGKD